MPDFITTSNITFFLGIVAILFSFYRQFRNPQERLEKKQAVTEKVAEGKAHILAQQLEWEKESNKRQFAALNKLLCDANITALNHVHTVDTKVDSLRADVNAMNLNICLQLKELETTIRLLVKQP